MSLQLVKLARNGRASCEGREQFCLALPPPSNAHYQAYTSALLNLCRAFYIHVYHLAMTWLAACRHRWVVPAAALALASLCTQADRYILTALASVPPPAACKPVCPADMHAIMSHACQPSTLCGACLASPPSRELPWADTNIQAHLCADQSQYALLASVAFAAPYLVGSAGWGMAVDAGQPASILVLCVLCSAVLTGLQALPGTVAGMAVVRAALGLMEAGVVPAAYVLLKQHVPASQRSLGNAVFSVSVYLGAGLAGLGLPLAQHHGWRAVCWVAAGTGVGAALLAALALGAAQAYQAPSEQTAERGPLLSTTLDDSQSTCPLDTPRGATPEPQSPHYQHNSVRQLWHTLRQPGVLQLCAAGGLRYMAGFSIAGWYSKSMTARFSSQADTFSAVYAVIIAVVGSVACLAGGGAAVAMLPRWWARLLGARLPAGPSHHPPGLRGLWVSAAGSAAAVLPALGMVLASPLALALTCLALEYASAESWFGPTLSAVQALAPAGASGTAVAAFTVWITLCGTAIEQVLGWAADASSDATFALVLAGVLACAYAGAAGMFVWAARAWAGAVQRRGSAATELAE